MNPIIGIDFDNTIVCYDALFYKVAREMDLVPDGIVNTKKAVRDYVQEHISNNEWTLLQAEVYGPRLLEAELYPGVDDFFIKCRMKSIPTRIISHKSRHPAGKKSYDLHLSAHDWLERNGFFSEDGINLSRDKIIFAETRQEKIYQICVHGCRYFIDDLPELFAEPDFPSWVKKMLFDPFDVHLQWSDGYRARSWDQIFKFLLSDATFKNSGQPEFSLAGTGRPVCQGRTGSTN